MTNQLLAELEMANRKINELKEENMKLIAENEAIKNIKYTVDETIYKSRIDKAVETIDLLIQGAYTNGNVSYWERPCCTERLNIVKKKLMGDDKE